MRCDAGSQSRLGEVYKAYPCTLDPLLQVLEEARLRSFNERPQAAGNSGLCRDRQGLWEPWSEIPLATRPN